MILTMSNAIKSSSSFVIPILGKYSEENLKYGNKVVSAKIVSEMSFVLVKNEYNLTFLIRAMVN